MVRGKHRPARRHLVRKLLVVFGVIFGFVVATFLAIGVGAYLFVKAVT